MVKKLIDNWIHNKEKLEECYNFYLKKKLIKKIKSSKNLSLSHLEKCEHNLEFVNFLTSNNKFSDWCIVGLYYSIYHISLALLTKKGFSSKNHLATLCCLMS
jgi:hypothetical protein